MTYAQRLQQRFVLRAAFFALYVLAPPLDIFRLDLTLGHFIVFGHDWTLGLQAMRDGDMSSAAAAWNLFTRAFLPAAGIVGLLAWVSWKYGRMYCGWLCPHFSVVEMINHLFVRASGKPGLWERKTLPRRQPNGSLLQPQQRYWYLVVLAIMGFGFLWAVVLLTYLLPPQEIYHNLLHMALTRNQAIFLAVATTLFMLEFLLARHLFCRFGCAVGLFQSFVWMVNKKAMVVGFDAKRVSACASCNAACDNACPMRLRPRAIKRMKFACDHCMQCLSACEQVQSDNPEGSLLRMLDGECALHMSDHDFGYRPIIQQQCFANDENEQRVVGYQAHVANNKWQVEREKFWH